MKKPHLIIIALAVVIGLIAAVILIVSGQKEYKTNNEIKNDGTKNTAVTEDSDTIIAKIESAITAELEGTNNDGQSYFQWMMVDQRIGDDTYLAVIRYNADTYGIEGDYKTKMQREKDEIISKIASVSKAIVQLGYPIGIISFEAYTGYSYPQYKIEMEKWQLDQIDWTQDVNTLTATLPSVWTLVTDSYAVYLRDT